MIDLSAASTSGSGTIALNGDNLSINYTPAANFNGTEVITYTVSDGTLSDATGKLTFTVTALIDAEDPITVNEDSALTSTNVIANDTDDDGNTLSLTAATTSGTGTVAVNADGLSIDYTPAANFNGTEIITYTVSDGTLTDQTGTLTLSKIVISELSPLGIAFENENTISNKINVIANDTDIEFDDLTLTAVTTSGTGTVTINADNLSVDYTPAEDFNGIEVITYTVSDGTDTDATGKLTITVNDAPLAVDDSATVAEDITLSITDVIFNDTDEDGDILSLTVVTSGTGTVEVADDLVSVKYTPALNFNGTEIVIYTVSDGKLEDASGTLTGTVTPVNDVPIAVDDAITINEDSSLTSTNVIANDTDIEFDTLSLTAATTSGTGTVAVNADGLSVDYTPALNFNGTETVTYSVFDETDTTATGTLTINVTAVNDAPVAVDDTLTVNEDASLTSVDVIANDTDVESDVLTLTAATTSGTGTVAVNDDGLSVDYTPGANFNGTEIITYTVSDGTLSDATGILVITVISVNNVPVAVDDIAFINENTTLNNINLISNDTDFENDALTLTVVTTAGTGTVAINADNLSVDYSPVADFYGTEVVTYTVSDGALTDATGTLTVTVNNINDGDGDGVWDKGGLRFNFY